MMMLNNDSIIVDGYTIEMHTKLNFIVITLPQTFETLTNTVAPIAKRRVSLSQSELLNVLLNVKDMLEGNDEID